MSATASDVIVLFGGQGSERLVSVCSAQHLTEIVPSARFWFWTPDGQVLAVTPEDLRRHESPFLVPFAPQRWQEQWTSLTAALQAVSGGSATVFLALHGGAGENGSLQAELEELGIAFTGSGSIASGLAFDKYRGKSVLKTHGLQTAEDLTFIKGEPSVRTTLADFLARFGKIVVKPIADGSSSGLAFLASPTELTAWWESATGQTLAYLAEEFIVGREITVGVIDETAAARALPCSEVVVEAGKMFDYAGKYLGRACQEITPADLTREESQRLQAMALTAHQALGCSGYSRSDFIMSPRGIYFLETNTLPGLTKASFIPQQLAAAGVSMEAFVARQIEVAQGRARGKTLTPTTPPDEISAGYPPPWS